MIFLAFRGKASQKRNQRKETAALHEFLDEPRRAGAGQGREIMKTPCVIEGDGSVVFERADGLRFHVTLDRDGGGPGDLFIHARPPDGAWVHLSFEEDCANEGRVCAALEPFTPDRTIRRKP